MWYTVDTAKVEVNLGAKPDEQADKGSLDAPRTVQRRRCKWTYSKITKKGEHRLILEAPIQCSGKPGVVAAAHSMLIAIYHVLNDIVAFKDLSADYYNRFNRERKANGMLKKLKALGCEMTIAAVPATA